MTAARAQCNVDFKKLLILGEFSYLSGSCILGFHLMSEKKLKLEILSFHLHQVKVIFEQIFSSVTNSDWVFPQCVTSALFLGNMLRARKYQFAWSFRVLSNQYVERTVYANVFKFNREKKRFDGAKLNSRCFHRLPAAMLESLRGAPKWRLQNKHSNF